MKHEATNETNVLYISNFPKATVKQQLLALFDKFGPLVSLQIIQKSQCSFAFAEYESVRDAVYAVKQLNQKVFHGMNLKVQFKNLRTRQKLGKIKSEEHEKLQTQQSISQTNPSSYHQKKQKNKENDYRTRNYRRIGRYSSNRKRQTYPEISKSRSRSREKRVCLNEQAFKRRQSNSRNYYQLKRTDREVSGTQIKNLCYELQKANDAIKYLQQSVRKLQKKCQYLFWEEKDLQRYSSQRYR